MKPIDIAGTVASLPVLLLAAAIYYAPHKESPETGLTINALATEFSARALGICPDAPLARQKELHSDVFTTVEAAAVRNPDVLAFFQKILATDGTVIIRARGDKGESDFYQTGGRWTLVLPETTRKGALGFQPTDGTLEYIERQSSKPFKGLMNGPPHSFAVLPCPS